MALAIDGSTPAVATQTNATIATLTTASFTPPANSLLLVLWSCDQATGGISGPTITDSLGTPLTYTQTDWQSLADSPSAGGQAAAWTAPVGSSAAMTVTVTTGAVSGERIAALKVLVITGQHATPVGAHGKAGSKSAASIAQSYTAQADNAWGFIADCDFDQLGAQTAGTGCTLINSANVSTHITYGFVRRTSADDVNGGSNTLNVTIPGTSTNLNWVYVEIKPSTSTAYSVPSPSFHPGRGPTRARFFQPPRDTTSFSASLTDAGAASDALTVVDVTVGAASPGGFHPGRGPTRARFYQPPRDTTVSGVTQVALSDTGVADDSLTVSATVPLTDTGSGSDALTVTATVPLSDTGTAADDSGVVSATVPLSESGTATDSLTVVDITVGAATPGGFHPGKGPTRARFFQTPRATDIITATPVAVSDAGSASDSLAVVSVTVPLSDAASAADTLAVTAQLALADAASTLDVLGITATVPLTDAAAGADGISVVNVGATFPGYLTDLRTSAGIDVPTTAGATETSTTAAGYTIHTSAGDDSTATTSASQSTTTTAGGG